MFFNEESIDVSLSPALTIPAAIRTVLVKQVVKNTKLPKKTRQLAAKHAAKAHKMALDHRTTNADIILYLANNKDFFSKIHLTDGLPEDSKALILALANPPPTKQQVNAFDDKLVNPEQLKHLAALWLATIIEYQLLALNITTNTESIQPDLLDDKKITAEDDQAGQQASMQQPPNNEKSKALLVILSNCNIELNKYSSNIDEDIDTKRLIELAHQAQDAFKLNTAKLFQRSAPNSYQQTNPDIQVIADALNKISEYNLEPLADDLLANYSQPAEPQPAEVAYSNQHIVTAVGEMLEAISAKVKKRRDQQTLSTLQTQLNNIKIIEYNSDSQDIVKIITAAKTLLAKYSSKKDYKTKVQDTLTTFKDSLLERQADNLTNHVFTTTQIKQMLINITTSQLQFFPKTNSNIRAELKRSHLELALTKLKSEVEANYEQITENIRGALYQHTSALFTCGKPHSLKLCQDQLDKIANYAISAE